MRRKRFLLTLFTLLLLSCRRAEVVTPVAPTPITTSRPITTLVPTFTPLPEREIFFPTATPIPTFTPAVLTTPGTAVPFDEKLVELRYRIPALGIDRRLEGNVAGRIIVVDETTQAAVQRNNQAVILIELQQSLPQLDLQPLPPNCDRCVQVSYELPLNDATDTGLVNRPRIISQHRKLYGRQFRSRLSSRYRHWLTT